MPIHYRFPQTLIEVTPDNRSRWRENHLKSLAFNYGRAPFLDHYLPALTECLNQDHRTLADLNTAVVELLSGWLDIRCRVVRSSTLSVNGASTERLVNLCKTLKADTYLSGSGGKGYLEEPLFKEAGIALEYQEFHHPVHRQVAFKNVPEFIPCLAAVDLLFNCGPDHSPQILRQMP